MKIKYSVLSLLILLLGNQLGMAQADTSVLSEGDWYKIPVMEDGIYKLDQNYLKSLGLDVSTIDASQIAIYGNAINGMLPQANATPRADDLIENAIYVSSDGRFAADDYVLFYGKSAQHISYDTTTEQFYIEKNVYADSAFYFLTIKNTSAKRITTNQNNTQSTTYATTYHNPHVHEADLYSLIRYGRNWYGERFNSVTLEHQVDFDTPNRVVGSAVSVYYKLVSTSESAASFDLQLNNLALPTINLSPINGYEYADRAKFNTGIIAIEEGQVADANELSLNFRYNRADNVSEGYIDYAHLITEDYLDITSGSIAWFITNSNLSFEIIFPNTALLIWDISDMTTPRELVYSTISNKARFVANDATSQLIAFNMSQTKIPLAGKKITNQNLHGIGAVDGFIITNRKFLASAQRLANFRTAHDGLLVEVVTVDQINNEFASGRDDISAIRDFLKLHYDRHQQLKYALLFGDGSYDYRGIRYVNSSLVPVYEARNSYNKINAFSSDDYFGFLEDEEGEWEESSAGDHTMEIGVGRLPIQTVEEGEAMVNKIIRYQTNKLGFGKWRNNISFVADDGQASDGASQAIHQTQANQLSVLVDTTQRDLHVKKLYLDAYIQDKTSNSSVKATRDFARLFSDGSLMVNYTGHGNEGVLTDDSLYTETMTESFKNNIIMPFLITATCQFGNYDNPGRKSGGEKIILLPQGGAVGMLTSTRPVYSNTNYDLNRAFYKEAMIKEEGQFRRLGDMMKHTKNISLRGSRNRNYALLADPMMRLNFPNHQIELTHINGQKISESDTLKALGNYLLKGNIVSNGSVLENFDGVVTVTVYDKRSKFKTLGDEGGKIMTFERRNVVLFQGESTVNNGIFDSNFILPKNINYSFGDGKMSFYAVNKNYTADAHGSYTNLVVGGSVPNTSSDQNPPTISLYLNDSTFLSGQSIGPSAILLARLEDESGINTSSTGFGNEITMYLDDEEPLPLNEFYTATLDSYKKGWIAFPMDNLTKGNHTLTLEVSDIFNNETEKTIAFYVTDQNGIQLRNVINYPNPISYTTEEVTLAFEHDRLGEDLDVTLLIIDLQSAEILNEKFRFENVSDNKLSLTWNLRNRSGSKVQKGMYIYRLTVRSQIDGSQSQVHRKIIILD